MRRTRSHAHSGSNLLIYVMCLRCLKCLMLDGSDVPQRSPFRTFSGDYSRDKQGVFKESAQRELAHSITPSLSAGVLSAGHKTLHNHSLAYCSPLRPPALKHKTVHPRTRAQTRGHRLQKELAHKYFSPSLKVLTCFATVWADCVETTRSLLSVSSQVVARL